MSAFVGTWKLTESHNFDKVMERLGVSLITRKVANSLKPTLIVTMDGDKMKMKTESTFKTTEVEFRFGEEVNEKTADGRDVKSTFTKDSDTKITQIQKHEKGDTIIVRQVEGNHMNTTVSVGDVVSTRKYERA